MATCNRSMASVAAEQLWHKGQLKRMQTFVGLKVLTEMFNTFLNSREENQFICYRI